MHSLRSARARSSAEFDPFHWPIKYMLKINSAGVVKDRDSFSACGGPILNQVFKCSHKYRTNFHTNAGLMPILLKTVLRSLSIPETYQSACLKNPV
jgi:hypothetical protein